MLITSRTPLRVSFVGGGTDYPEYFHRYPGAVVGMAINKYIYISALKLLNFIDYKYRLSYRRTEMVKAADEIVHPVVRAVLQHYRVDEALDINVIADLPASSGLGSSSAFTVGLLNLIAALRDKEITRIDLGMSATFVERELLKERVGVQDQLHAAFGGINRFDFDGDKINISPVRMEFDCQDHLMRSLFLVYTGMTRSASDTLDEQLEATKEKKVDNHLGQMLGLVAQTVDILQVKNPDKMLAEFGAMLHEGWMTKRQLSSKITNNHIDELYQKSIASGALGGKLCGAGSGGFLLVVVPPDRQAAFCNAMQGHHIIPIQMDSKGSAILHG